MSTTHTDIWTYRDNTWSTASLVGFDVEAVDGAIGVIDEASTQVGASYLVIDTGPWIFGKRVMLPAGIVRSVDHSVEKVFVNRTKDQIKNAPRFDEDSYRDESYRSGLGSYYGPGGVGYREW